MEPLRGSDAPGDKASIQRILARSEPRRIRHGRHKTWVEEYLVQWGPEHCTFGEALEQYYLGFDIESITSLDDSIRSQDLLPFVAKNDPIGRNDDPSGAHHFLRNAQSSSLLPHKALSTSAP